MRGKSTDNVTSQKAHNESSSALAAELKSGSTNPSISGSQAETTPTSQVANITSQVANASQFDVALYRDKVKGMDTSGVCTLIKNVFKPTKEYCFPKHNGRSFRYDWLNLYPWLCYSPSKDGAYSLSCVLFGDRFPTKTGRISRLFSEPLCHWNDAASTLKRHVVVNGLHSCTFPILTSLLSQISGAAQSIDVVIDNNLKEEVRKNRQILNPIVDSVIFCGRLGLPLRGHRDDAKYHPEVGKYSTGGVGNFVESLNFRVRAGDEVLENHLRNCGKNRTYISKTSQNRIINNCGEVIVDKIIHDIKESKFYTIIADEASDSSHKEQLSLVLRFVDCDMNIREEFISFLHCKWGLSGKQLARLILEALDALTLSIDDCRGQGYDGAGAVAGHINGLSAQILRANPKALYTHCYSHRLNLTICDSLNILEVNNMLKHVKDASNFINPYQTRNIPFEQHIKDYESNLKKSRLTDVCRTRWVERVEGLDVFQELFVPLYHTRDDMSTNLEGQFKPSLSSDASSLLTLISRFDFVVALVITRNILDLTLPVTQLLQGKSIDVMDGIHLIDSLKNDVTKLRNSVDTFHETWYEEALELAEQVDIEEWKPRTVGRQTTRANIPHNSISEYYKFTITIPLIDHLNSSLEARFDLDSVNVYKGLCIIPVKLLSLVRKGINWKDQFKTVAKFYINDLPNPLALDAELMLWSTYWETHEGPHPDNIASTLKAVSFSGFENIKVILRILGTLPITSCECERSISALRTLKNYQRSTMVEDRLNGLALMKIHQEIVPDVEKVIDKFSVGNTRLKFS